MVDKIVWLIEDNETNAEEYTLFLEHTEELVIRWIKPRPGIDDYSDLIAAPETGAFILDQRLSEGSDANYTGLALAEYIQSVRPDIPLYILTGYPDEDVEHHGHSVDAVIRKSFVRDHADVSIKRILRAMQRYEEALSERQRSIKNLIDKKVTEGLATEEQAELDTLRGYAERPFEKEIERQEASITDRLDAQDEEIARVEALFQNIMGKLSED